MFLRLTFFCFFLLPVISAEDWGKGGMTAESTYMQKNGAGKSRHYLYRPGHATNTHSCEKIREVPDDLRSEADMRPDGLTDFYQKYTEAYGIPVVGSSKVSDDAMKRACYTMRFLFADREDIREAYYKAGGRFTIVGKEEKFTDIPEFSEMPKSWAGMRAVGGVQGLPVSVGAEENALCADDDQFRGDDIVLHMALHGFHTLGASTAVDGFEDKLKKYYDAAKKSGKWKGTYAETTPWEYFAESGQSYFNSHGLHNGISTRDQLKTGDKSIHDLHAELFPCNNEYIPPCKSGKESSQKLKMNCGGANVDRSDNADEHPQCAEWVKEDPKCENEKYQLKIICKKSCKVA